MGCLRVIHTNSSKSETTTLNSQLVDNRLLQLAHPLHQQDFTSLFQVGLLVVVTLHHPTPFPVSNPSSTSNRALHNKFVTTSEQRCLHQHFSSSKDLLLNSSSPMASSLCRATTISSSRSTMRRRPSPTWRPRAPRSRPLSLTYAIADRVFVGKDANAQGEGATPK